MFGVDQGFASGSSKNIATRRNFLKSGVAAASAGFISARSEVAAHQPLRAVLAPYTKPTLIAHRGSSWDAPEHTLAAYELAIKQGADFVEPDLQLTKDGVLVCLHDTTLERTTNVAQVFPDRFVEIKGKKKWPVADFSLSEIQMLDAGSWKDAKFAGARVPTFQQMIDLIRGKAGIIPETKAPEVYGSRGMNMEKALTEVLKSNHLDAPATASKTPVIIQSFSSTSLEALRNQHGCKVPLVYLFSDDSYAKETLAAMKKFADGIAPNKAVVLKHPDIIENAHSLGMSVTVWTFRAGQTGTFKSVREEMQYFLNMLHVDAVFTDNPDQFPRD